MMLKLTACVVCMAAIAGAEAVVLVPDAGAAANRMAIQREIDRVSAAGGGRVEIPVGEWLTGSLELKSGVELHLPKGAALKGSPDRSDYNANDEFPGNRWSDAEEWSGGHLVWAWCAENIAITGEGTIDGNGPVFFGECDEDSRWPWYKYGLKLHPLDRDWFRPGMMLAFFRCRNVRISDITLARTTAWTCHLRCCDGVDIRGVTVDADRTIANSDGFSIDCTRNVKVEKCIIRTGDDGFAIRASCKLHATTNFCENIEIRECDVSSCCYGIRFGIGTGTIRNVRVYDTRIREAAESGIGFTPAWVPRRRNCHIEDILLSGCTISQCVRPVSGGPSGGDSRVVGIRFENCLFETLLPISLSGGPCCEMSFKDCTRRTIDRFAVRHRRGWKEGEIRNKRFTFAEIGGDKSRIAVESCRPRPFGSDGILLMSFDGREFSDWEKVISLFAKYGAHATFFVSGEFTPDAVRTAKKLLAGGHSIGLCGQLRSEVLTTVRRQADVAYIPVRNFAYPDGSYDEATDKSLLERFDRLREPILGGDRPGDPNGGGKGSLKPLVTDDRMFFSVADLPKRRVLGCVQIGEGHTADIDDIVACIKRAGERKEVFVIASHGIHLNAKQVHLKTEWLEKILAAAQECGVSVLGLEEVPLKLDGG